MKNDIYNHRTAVNASDMSPEELEEWHKVKRMSNGIEKAEIQKRLNAK